MNQFFNANHSPIGAYASFTLGYPGAKGGPGMERTGPADTNVYVGVQKRGENAYQALPFFVNGEDEARRYDVEKADEKAMNGFFDPFLLSEVKREFLAGTDTFTAGDVKLTIYSRAVSVPDPQQGDTQALRHALVPAVTAEFEIDNRGCEEQRMAFFGFDKVEYNCALRHFWTEGMRGMGQGGRVAVFTDDQEGVDTASGFAPACILAEEFEENRKFNNGNTGLLLFQVPANEKKVYRLAICFYQGGVVTYGQEGRYFYTELFSRIEEVGSYALKNFGRIKEESLWTNREFDDPKLTQEQRFMLAHAIRSYYNSTELLIVDQKPLWIVNEGEFRMMNTLDLTVDQVFFEARQNPWTIRNELDFFLENYSYHDEVFFPGSNEMHPGGLTFCHDCGVANQFTRKGHSTYEKCGLTGCFSYMSQEQLTNWLLCAFVYYHTTKDEAWMTAKKEVIKECFASMLNRDHPDPAKRNGMMGLDSNRTKGGSEITTYDSLDISLGQARNNIYLGSKCWAVYVILEKYFAEHEMDELAAQAAEQAKRCAATITAAVREDGTIPAVLEKGNNSMIIPAIEGLVYPFLTGCEDAVREDGVYGSYIRALKTHFRTVMANGQCVFADGGWKLSSTSDNSWLSKIYLSEFVAREIFCLPAEEYTVPADKAHVAWLTHREHSYWCWSDQIVAGNISASKYYPRGVTSILWLLENREQ